MKQNETIISRKLTIEEIKSLPLASVIWYAREYKTDEGIVWHCYSPVMVCVPGDNGELIGGDEASIIEVTISDKMMNDPIDSFWNYRPEESQLKGITEEEYNSLTDEERIVNTELAALITSKGMTFTVFCENAGLNYEHFWESMIGKREFVQHEIVTIRNILNLSDDETMRVFFPAALARI